MELRQLEYFIAVAEEANFTRAAERVHISQSGVSAQIKKLEHDLGATLIDRSGRSATLTTAGVAALEHARAVLGSVDALRQAVNDVTGLIQGRLVVGMITGCTVQGLFDTLASFHLTHPGVEITLIEDNSEPLTERVRAGAIDLALIGANEWSLAFRSATSWPKVGGPVWPRSVLTRLCACPREQRPGLCSIKPA